MLNGLWGGMILIGIIYAAITGNMEAITTAALDSSKEAVTLCITMLGVVAMWSGLMEVAASSGLVAALSKKMEGILSYLFPHIPEGHSSRAYIAMNMIANMLGLGWAATPAGLKAMESLTELEKERKMPAHRASDEMCTFLIINISSLQLIPVNMIAYRSQYGSVNPAAIIAPGLVATLASTIAAVIFCKLRCARRRGRE